jgi:hypothetical protein
VGVLEASGPVLEHLVDRLEHGENIHVVAIHHGRFATPS